MGARLVKVRILQNFAEYQKGQTFEDWPGGMCQVLIGRGLVEEIKDEPVLEASDEQPPVEQAVRPAYKPKRR